MCGNYFVQKIKLISTNNYGKEIHSITGKKYQILPTIPICSKII